MKIKLHWPTRLGIFAFALLFFLASCEKEELTPEKKETYTESEIEKRFFDYDYMMNTNPYIVNPNTTENTEIVTILELARNENKQNPYAENMTRSLGYPAWSESLLFQANGDQSGYFIPFATINGKATTAILVATKAGSEYQFLLHKGSKLNDASFKENDSETYNTLLEIFRTIDSELFGNTTRLEAETSKIKAKTREDCGIITYTCGTIDKEEAFTNSNGKRASGREDYCPDGLEVTGSEYIPGNCIDGSTTDPLFGGGTIGGALSGFSGSGSSSGGSSGSSFGEEGSPDSPDYGIDPCQDANCEGGGEETEEDEVFALNQLLAIQRMVGVLTQEQKDFLLANDFLRNELYDIALDRSLTQDQKAEQVFEKMSNIFFSDAIAVVQEIAILKIQNPDWSLARAAFWANWNVYVGKAHTVLDLVGLVPALGEGADFINGVLYTLEGDGVNALISFASTVPFVPATAGRVVKEAGLIIKSASSGRKITLKFIKKNGVITFGSRSQLNTVLNTPSGSQAHHIAPWSLNGHTLIQKAAETGKYHPNHSFNGINLSKTVHSGYDAAHRTYNKKIEKALDEILINKGGNVKPEEALEELQDLINIARSQLEQGKLLDQIDFN